MNKIKEVLKKVIYPGFKKSVVDFGFVKDIEVSEDGKKAIITYQIPSSDDEIAQKLDEQGYPMKDTLDIGKKDTLIKKLAELNIESTFIKGLRVTDDKMINIVEDVLVELNKEIVNALKNQSCKARRITTK